MKILLRKSKKRHKKPMVQIPWLDKVAFDFEKKWLEDREKLWWKEGAYLKTIVHETV